MLSKPLLLMLLGLACSGKSSVPSGTFCENDKYLVGQYGPSILATTRGTAFGKFFEEDSVGWHLRLREPLYETFVDSVYFVRTSDNLMELLVHTWSNKVMFFVVDTSGRQENYEYLGTSVLSTQATVGVDSTKLMVDIYLPGPLDFKPYNGTCRIASNHDHIGFTVMCDAD